MKNKWSFSFQISNKIKRERNLENYYYETLTAHKIKRDEKKSGEENDGYLGHRVYVLGVGAQDNSLRPEDWDKKMIDKLIANKKIRSKNAINTAH